MPEYVAPAVFVGEDPAGAVPIVEGGSVVGAVAVAGGTEEQDQRCAEVALASYV